MQFVLNHQGEIIIFGEAWNTHYMFNKEDFIKDVLRLT